MKRLGLLHQLVMVLFVALISACSKSAPALKASVEEELIMPDKAIGILPANAETCSDFKELPGDDNKATIYFSWSTAENALSYLVQVFEGGTEINNITVTTAETELTLEKGKSYTWTVTAINNDGETVSSTFSFTTPGQPIGNYAPYAAQIITDYNVSDSELSISWIGSDEDGDTLTYDVKVSDTDGNELVDQTNLSATSLDPISISTGKTYTIQITTRDNFGNFSIATHTEISD
ncbi:MAG: hypothetical protein RIM68_00940 [Arenibacter sp.]|jgi:hypothetical protein